jgi:uncharacterized protein YerC
MSRPVEPELADNPRVEDLCRALATCCDDEELTLRFMRDLLSFREIQDLANRWAAARMLLDGRTQASTAQELGMSTKTVNEVALWVNGPFATGGYREVHERYAASNKTTVER